MPLVEVTLTTGRSPAQVRSMISGVTQALVDADIAPKDTIRVVVREIPAEHFAAGDVTIAERRAGTSNPSDPQKGADHG
ncbi:tautomerase family protein [Mobilicoccus caccae]|uniref:4-oxalocrotonate tautomerase-like domain-containing protein n=1 Tax=Mobilicoccus caccae TaxID=1859295 RepID=A0ABQ6IWA5_9MICO|nr:tautomerase family protein [Mobilicoccus caccae]GMA42233.1 hypothetical protein GCM10025883_42780 [Mobilicoccus caccae]